MADVRKIETTLREFGKVGIKPNDSVMSAGIEKAELVFKLLQRKSNFSLDRFIISGSVGKHSAIENMYDFDLVVFVNNASPPFDKVLDDFQDVLLMCERNITPVHKTKHSVQFEMDDFKFDLLPAANLIHESNRTSDWIVKEQRHRVLQKIKEDPREAYTYSTSLVESQVGFMKKQTAFVHELVRLCKFWNKTIYVDENISGRSTIIELIAVHAGKNEKQNSDTPMLRAFKAFLELVKNVENMQIIFDGVEPEIPVTRSFLLEPANPFNNLLASWKPTTKALFRRYANETLALLEHLCNTPGMDYIPLEILFGTQIDPAMINSIAVGNTIKDARVGTRKVATDKAVSMVVRNNSLDNYQIRNIQKVIEAFIFTTITAATNAGNSNLTSGQVQTIVTEKLNESIYRENPVQWVTGKDNDHERFGMTFTIPYQIKGERYEVKVSFDPEPKK